MKQAMGVTAALIELRTDCCLADRAVSRHDTVVYTTAARIGLR